MIPIFRAKKLDSDEYVDGCLNIWEQNGKIYHSIMEIGKYPSPFNNIHIIEDSTLSIHFPDMLDNQGNKIFAGLQEDGKGGDICYVKDFSYGDLQGVARYEDNYFRIHRKGKAMGISLKSRDIKIIGIQQ